MGKLIKNHLARLIILAAATYQIAASFECYFWPKLFFDTLTKNLDHAVKPIPILQTLNLIFGLFAFCLEYPLPLLAGLGFHRSIEVRLFLYLGNCLLCILMYQGTDPSIWFLIGLGVYFWAYCEGEVVCSTAWTLPARRKGGAKV